MSKALQSEKSPISLIFSRAVSSPVFLSTRNTHTLSPPFSSSSTILSEKLKNMLHKRRIIQGIMGYHPLPFRHPVIFQ